MSDDQMNSQTGDDLAMAALAAADQSDNDSEESEVEKSNQLAATLNSLQNVIERNAESLQAISKDIKEKREELGNVFANDSLLTTAEEQAKQFTTQVKERRAALQADAQVTALKVQIGEMSEQKKEIEETLSNHLVNYYSLTNSTSFDTSDGDQWEFSLKAKVKSRKK